MQIKIYKGKLGKENLIYDLGDTRELDLVPRKGDLISLGNSCDCTDTVYRIIDVMHGYAVYDGHKGFANYSDPEYSIFVEEYDWED